MNTRSLFHRWSLEACLLVLVTSFPISLSFLSGCGFSPAHQIVICDEFEKLPLTGLTASPDPMLVFEEVGKIKVMRGVGSAKLNSGNFIKVEQSVSVPDYANQATVFLNGWRLNYLGDDQHVLMLGTLIAKIKLDQRNHKLTWDAVGVLRDDDAKEGYNFTYHYTVLAWNDTAVNLIVDQGDPDNFCRAGTDLPDNSYLTNDTGMTTALSSFSSFVQNPNFPPGKPVAVLPRGFAFAWSGGDHHLLQVAYNLDDSEIFAENDRKYKKGGKLWSSGEITDGEIPAPLPNPPASRVDSGFVSWNAYAIFKDNDDRRDYLFGEIVSAAGGTDVGVLQVPFAILPREGEGGGSFTGGLQTKEFVIENIPFRFAIPMLTGWELGYLTDDQHVRDVGIWIDDWTYEIGVGRLRYKLFSILADNDSWPDHYNRHKVTILGIEPVTGVIGREKQ